MLPDFDRAIKEAKSARKVGEKVRTSAFEAVESYLKETESQTLRKMPICVDVPKLAVIEESKEDLVEISP